VKFGEQAGKYSTVLSALDEFQGEQLRLCMGWAVESYSQRLGNAESRW